jgi:O-acetylhomoserine (thiol)-lyase
LALAQWLEAHPKVESVNYPGLKSSPSYAHAQKYLPKGAGGVLSFIVKGSKENAGKVVNRLQLVSHLANVGDAKTLIIQPSATTHSQLPEEAQLAAGVFPAQLRVSVGIEHIDDIIADFRQALESI